MLEIQQKKSNVRISTLEYTPCMHQLCMSTKSGIAIGHLSVAFAPPLQRKQYGRKSNNELKLHWNCVCQLSVHSRIDGFFVLVGHCDCSDCFFTSAGRPEFFYSFKNSYARYDKFASWLRNHSSLPMWCSGQPPWNNLCSFLHFSVYDSKLMKTQ